MKSSAYPPFPPNTHTIDTPSPIFTKKSWSAPRSDFSKITTPPIYKGEGGGGWSAAFGSSQYENSQKNTCVRVSLLI